MEKIPFVDLRAQHEEVRQEIDAAIAGVIDRSEFIGGNAVKSFEGDFAAYLGVKEVVGVGNGTDALWLALLALNIGAEDAVLTVPNTFIATVEAITRTGAIPLFVDIDLRTALMDLGLLERFLAEKCSRAEDGRIVHMESRRTVKAIIPVHLYGLPLDMEKLTNLARTHQLQVVEDACQSHGAYYTIRGQPARAGTQGIASGFSFYPGKNLGALGDAGAVTTNAPELAQKMRWLRDHGSSEKYIHISWQGWNSRLDSLQAAVLSIKLKKLDEWNERRRKAAAFYHETLSRLPLELPGEPAYAKPVYHLYVVRCRDHATRERLREGLSAKGIGVGLHYPIPLHLQKAYRHLEYREGDFPNAERSAATGLSLPMHPALTKEQIQRVADACSEILSKE